MARERPLINPLLSDRISRSHTLSRIPQTQSDEEAFSHRQLDKDESFYTSHSHSFPRVPTLKNKRIPSVIYTEKSVDSYQIRSPGFPPPAATSLPLFAPPPRAHSFKPLPTSTHIPNVDYPQAGFSAIPIAHSKDYDIKHEFQVPLSSPVFYQQQQHQQQRYYGPPPVEEIHILNSASNEKSLLEANKTMSQPQQYHQEQPQQHQPQEYQHQPQQHQDEYQMQPGAQMRFDPPPTEPITQQPQTDAEQGMTYDQGYAINSNGQPHAPGQISHPNQLLGPQQFKNSLCSCFGDIGSCCLGCWCPCMLYSRTNHRLKTLPNSNLDQYGSCNGHCMMWCALAPVSWVFTMIQRTRIREMYHIQGSPAGDCANAYCCSVCVLVQDEREIRDREEEKRRCAGPGSGVVGEQGYKKPEKMAYQRSSVIG